MTTMKTDLRNATLKDLAELLQTQQDAKIDVVVRADQLRSEDGNLVVPGVSTVLTETGVDVVPGLLRPTEVCDGSLADKLQVPVKYLRRLRTEDTLRSVTHEGQINEYQQPLLDAVLNAHFRADSRKVLVRGFKADPDQPTLLRPEGIARAVLSDTFGAIDHLDSLTAVLAGAHRSGKQVEVTKVDLTERAMRVHFIAPEITALAPTLLRGYRSPFEGRTGPHGAPGEDGGLPIVFAGFVASNSETGGGAFQIVPRLVVQICSNGLTMTRDAFRKVHLGARIDEGVVRWSQATLAANVDLIAKQTADAVATFLDVEYMEGVIAGIEARAEEAIDRPEEAIKIVAQKLRYTDEERETLLSHFIRGGQGTAGGLLNAVTSMAQSVPSADRAAEIEAGALDAFALVAS